MLDKFMLTILWIFVLCGFYAVVEEADKLETQIESIQGKVEFVGRSKWFITDSLRFVPAKYTTIETVGVGVHRELVSHSKMVRDTFEICVPVYKTREYIKVRDWDFLDTYKR